MPMPMRHDDARVPAVLIVIAALLLFGEDEQYS